MGTMNFSIPDDVKEAFNKAFAGENKSAIVADLMRKAVEDQDRRAREQAQLDELIRDVLAARDKDAPVATDTIRAARDELRK